MKNELEEKKVTITLGRPAGWKNVETCSYGQLVLHDISGEKFTTRAGYPFSCFCKSNQLKGGETVTLTLEKKRANKRWYIKLDEQGNAVVDNAN